MQKAAALLRKYREQILYLLFGAGTTLVNVLVYYLCYAVWDVSNTASVVVAWMLSVAFAFVTNRRFVFASHEKQPKKVAMEAVSFFGFRFATGILDFGIMYVTVDLLVWNGTWMKLLSNIVVVILNYVFSKWLIFKR